MKTKMIRVIISVGVSCSFIYLTFFTPLPAYLLIPGRIATTLAFKMWR